MIKKEIRIERSPIVPTLRPVQLRLALGPSWGLGALLEPYGELLPLAHPQHKYFALNVAHVIDALDEATSSVVRFPSSGRIMTVQSNSFRPEALAGELVFKESRLVRLQPFVTKAFVDRVAELGLTGFAFRKVWSSENTVRGIKGN